jgi:uncharacterized protein YbaA (DUF1428 family)
MSRYVDGYVVPVPKRNLRDYRRVAEAARQVWREHGALEYIEFIAEDMNGNEATLVRQSIRLRPDETIVLAWVVYESREHRDRVNEQVMKDPRIAMSADAIPFDGKRMMFWGGFELRGPGQYLSGRNKEGCNGGSAKPSVPSTNPAGTLTPR